MQLESQSASYRCPQGGTQCDQELRLNIYVLENSVVGALFTLLEAALPPAPVVLLPPAPVVVVPPLPPVAVEPARHPVPMVPTAPVVRFRSSPGSPGRP